MPQAAFPLPDPHLFRELIAHGFVVEAVEEQPAARALDLVPPVHNARGKLHRPRLLRLLAREILEQPLLSLCSDRAAVRVRDVDRFLRQCQNQGACPRF